MSVFSQAIEAFRRGDLDLALSLARRLAHGAAGHEWHHLMGLIYCRKGEPARGVEHLRLAAEAQPENQAYKVMLARALTDAGNPDAVMRMAKPATPETPAEVALWHAHAEAAEAAGQKNETVNAWQVLAAFRPRDPNAWLNLGRSLLKLNRLGEAEAAYRKALEVSPRSIPALFELGLVYERTNQLDELEALLERSAQQGIGRDELAFLWAIREQRAGNFRNARELLLKCDPNRDPVAWLRLRARIADKEGDSAAAFEATAAMNRAMPDFGGWRDRASAYRSDIRAAANMMTPSWASGLATLPRVRTPPVFLMGFPRSGTTLLDTFLMGHPSLVVIEEKEMLRRAGERAGSLERLPEISTTELELARDSYFSELSGLVAKTFGGKIVDKQPLNMLAGPYIHALFPGAPIIFVQRHPCDVVLSAFMQSFEPNLGMASFLDLADAADMYDCAMDLWTRATEVLPLNVHTVVYEDLVRDPETQLRQLIDFLQLEWTEGLLNHRATAKARGAIMNTSYDQVTEKLSASAVGRWRRYEKQLEPVLPVLLPWAEKLGYPGSTP